MDIYKESLKIHEESKGKIEVISKLPLKNKHDLSLAYTPGVAEPCRQIAKDKDLAYKFTIKGNTVAVVTDGSAVLGLGNIGAIAALPVMEGKAILFKEFAGIDAFPICLDNPDTIVETVRSIAPVFGGINLEDIAAPRCFDIEAQLQDLGIPVMHDDQHGTAVVLLAALINACKVSKKKFEDLTIVINGAGAAGIAIAKLLKCVDTGKECISVRKIIVCDTKGIINKNRADIHENKYKIELTSFTNPENISGSLSDALKGADVFIGVSKGNILTESLIRSMNTAPIIFALANPDPEVLPDIAKKAGASVVGTGRSDFPNQINNVLAFPGIFRGALDARKKKISNTMKIAAARALAAYVKSPTADAILPSPLDKGVAPIIAKAVAGVNESKR